MKTISMMLVLLLGSATASFAAELPAQNEFVRKPYHFNLGVGANIFAMTGFEDSEAIVTGPAVGTQAALDWQGNGRLGFQIPVSYYYHPEMHGHEFNFGGNLMVHFTKRDKKLDPYFAAGLKWVGGFVNSEAEDNLGGIMPIPFLNTGLGVRYMIKPNIGVFGEAVASNLLFMAWQFEGRVGVSFGF